MTDAAVHAAVASLATLETPIHIYKWPNEIAPETASSIAFSRVRLSIGDASRLRGINTFKEFVALQPQSITDARIDPVLYRMPHHLLSFWRLCAFRHALEKATRNAIAMIEAT